MTVNDFPEGIRSEFCVRYILFSRVTYEYFSSLREGEIVDQNVSVEFADIR